MNFTFFLSHFYCGIYDAVVVNLWRNYSELHTSPYLTLMTFKFQHKLLLFWKLGVNFSDNKQKLPGTVDFSNLCFLLFMSLITLVGQLMATHDKLTCLLINHNFTSFVTTNASINYIYEYLTLIILFSSSTFLIFRKPISLI